MRPPRLLLALLALPASLLVACGDNQEPANARDLYRRIQAADYRSWRRPPGYETRQKTSAPHGDSVDIYVNAVVAEALDAGAPLEAWPEGSLIVKDGFEDGDLELVAAMEKRDGAWFWAEYYDGDAKYSGQPDICLECHERGQNDFVRAFPMPR